MRECSDINLSVFIADLYPRDYAATVARLYTDATFRMDLEAAKAALAAVRAKSLKPTRDCNDEASAMVLQIPMVK